MRSANRFFSASADSSLIAFMLAARPFVAPARFRMPTISAPIDFRRLLICSAIASTLRNSSDNLSSCGVIRSFSLSVVPIS
ncbi:hypothetical protein BZM27_06065 [Paraburkholderia steynii]|uniref:Uncharacterized protein n=1 Tax=Paraburkholderia steynii TaxID=1245441 RepID=A0A4R0XFR6_9BURK|nr:hypothetical protein BZM27_06065 [Paraburkholderia steynii]